MKTETAFGLIELMLASLLFFAVLLPISFTLNKQLKIFTKTKHTVESYPSNESQNCQLHTLANRIIINCDNDKIFFF